ncbi:hypothetical protein, partial [Amycolatopsis sp. NPDC059021]|uniref:hypothetical protein n=1 Tax=Amycolatopsis sp. NPDC059021 TaxID=3346704 RepID=UPI00366B4C17
GGSPRSRRVPRLRFSRPQFATPRLPRLARPDAPGTREAEQSVAEWECPASAHVPNATFGT